MSSVRGRATLDSRHFNRPSLGPALGSTVAGTPAGEIYHVLIAICHCWAFSARCVQETAERKHSAWCFPAILKGCTDKILEAVRQQNANLITPFTGDLKGTAQAALFGSGLFGEQVVQVSASASDLTGTSNLKTFLCCFFGFRFSHVKLQSIRTWVSGA